MPGTVLKALVGVVLGAGVAAQDPYAEEVRPIVAEYCGRCHGAEGAKGGVEIVEAVSGEDVRKAAATWSRVVRQVRAGAMPPKGAPQPEPAEREALVIGVEAVIGPVSARAEGVVVARRLSRFEFDRTVKAVFGVAYDSTRTFPADAPAHGIDNLGDVMSLPPLLLEKYADAATEIAAAGPAWDEIPALLRRAFRRPPDPEEIASRRALFDDLLAGGATLDEAFDAVVRSVVLSPHFLFRVETGAPPPEAGGPRPLTPHELATRLSYFLWAAPPDPALAALAESGRLGEPAALAAEVRRMLADPQSRAMADGFAAAWLRYREVLTQPADYRRFPQIWNDRLRPSMYEEAARTFDAIVREDRNVLLLLDAPTVFVNGTLARHYGIPGVSGEEFREVAAPDRRRGGLLGMAATLMVTSTPLRTSPTLRGAWILTTLLGDPPPPPPPGAGTLPPDDVQRDALTLRERLEAHRRNPSCAACHARIDPFGLALENYDALGVWRAEWDERLVDARAELPGGTVVDGPAELKRALLGRRRDFLAALARAVFVHAVGRPAGAADDALIHGLVDALEAGGHRWSVLVQGLVASAAFRTLAPGGVAR